MAKLILDLDDTELNNNWLGSLRLLENGDEDSMTEFERRDNTKLIPLSELEKILKTKP